MVPTRTYRYTFRNNLSIVDVGRIRVENSVARRKGPVVYVSVPVARGPCVCVPFTVAAAYGYVSNWLLSIRLYENSRLSSI